MKAHLLFEDADFDVGGELPPNHEDLTRDLELSTLLLAMAGEDGFLYDVSQRVLLASVTEPEVILHRQRVLSDCIAHPEVIRELYDLSVDAIEDRRSIWGGYGGSYRTPRSSLAGAVSHLEAYIGRLRQLRQIADERLPLFESEGLRKLLSTLRGALSDEYFDEVDEHLKRLKFRSGMLISAELDRDNSGINFVLRASEATGASWRHRLGLGSRSSLSFTVPSRDDAGIQVIQDLTNRGINLVANAAAQSADHLKSYFTMLRFELGFYVSCLNLWHRLEEKGVPCSFPLAATCGVRAFTCTDLRDVCLALRSDDAVTGNDVDADERTLVIVTGANSGGKSTFLRSSGTAQLMLQCGLFVTARSFRADLVRGVFTHFAREEDRSMTSGRFDEELSRMSETVDQLHPDCLILFNESFAGTNELEGSEIARQIVRALLEARTKVFYVTHRFDFAASFFESRTDSMLFLRADRMPDGRRNFKLVVGEPLVTSFGEDLYYRLGPWLDEDQQTTSARPRSRRGVAGETPGDP
ncbi:MAG: MutS-related protein [Acidimicrobiales bacterium]